MLVALLSVAAAVRLTLVALEWPATNSDEATFGLMATRIAQGRGFPGFMDGQSYMGTLQAYLAAVVFAVTGPSLAALRAVMVGLFLAWLVALHALAHRLFGRGVALVSVGLLALGSREMLGMQLVAQGAVPETLLAGTLLLLLGHQLLADDDRWTAWRLAAWGFTATLGLWSTVLVAPFVVASGVLVAIALRRRPVRGGRRALTAGLVAGALPWVVHDVTSPWQESGVVSIVRLYLAGGTGMDAERSAGLSSQLVNTLTTSLAYVTGGSAVAHPSAPPAWPYGYDGSWTPPTDDVVSTLWGVALVALWTTAVVTAVRALRRQNASPARDRGLATLAVLAAAGLTVVAFAVSPTPGVAPANNVRYLVGVLVATPAVLAPLWRVRVPRAGGALRVAVLAVTLVSLGLGTARAMTDAGTGPAEAGRRQLAAALERAGVRHVWSGYLECNRLTFLSRERVVCAVVRGDATTGLLPGFDRYLPYRAAVRADPAAAYVFRAGDPRLGVLATTTCTWRARWQVAGYEVWQPASPCPPSGEPVLTRCDR